MGLKIPKSNKSPKSTLKITCRCFYDRCGTDCTGLSHRAGFLRSWWLQLRVTGRGSLSPGDRCSSSFACCLAKRSDQQRLILCGHSFGVSVSKALAEIFEITGILSSHALTIVALDCRCREILCLSQPSSPLPRKLSEFVSSFNSNAFRIESTLMPFTAPLVPRGIFANTRAFR